MLCECGCWREVYKRFINGKNGREVDNRFIKGHNAIGKTREFNNRWGTHHTEETKNKMSEAQSNKKNWNYGNKIPDIVKQKISLTMTGIIRSRETKNKMSKNHWKEYSLK